MSSTSLKTSTMYKLIDKAYDDCIAHIDSPPKIYSIYHKYTISCISFMDGWGLPINTKGFTWDA